MRKLCFLAVAVATLASPLFAQEEGYKPPSQASIKYHEFRYKITEPSYGLSKVKALIKKIKPSGSMDDGEGQQKLDDKAYNALSVEEKFTYTMIHGEVWTQNCDAMMGIIDEEKKAFAYFPSPFGGEELWSERQKQFLVKNRSKVIPLIRSTMTKNHHVGSNLKAAIMEINAYELIPDLVKIYNRDKKDHDILTLFFQLMKENSYKPFMESATYKKLYGPEANYESFIVANAANQKLTIDRATEFYKSKTKKK